ncbi:acetyltransferase [Streptomyces thinghirensis]|nr:acetyltransferase [Streptomyces thinghirensis]
MSEQHMSPYASRAAVHEQELDGFGAVRVLPLDAARDAGVIHRWVSEERAAFWGTNGLTRDQVAGVYAHMDTLDTHHAFLVVKDGEPVALLQTYDPGSRPGERSATTSNPATSAYTCCWRLPGTTARSRAGPPRWRRPLTAYVLLGLDRKRIVVDPDVGNEKAIARFLKQGFTAGPAVVLPEIDLPDVYLPEKKAQLAFLRREVAFGG